MSLKEAHNKFVEENPENRVGLSKFCELRLDKVKLFDHIPHNICVCSYHENIRLLLVALKKHYAFYRVQELYHISNGRLMTRWRRLTLSRQ